MREALMDYLRELYVTEDAGDEGLVSTVIPVGDGIIAAVVKG